MDITKIKEETFLFTDKQIIDTIKKYNTTDPVEVMFYLYKGIIINKEEYTKEVIQYLYANSIDSKATVNSVVDESSEWFYDQYEKACKGETTYYHAVQYCRNQLMGFLRHRLVDNSNNDDIEDDFEEDYFSQKYKE